jgi:hypothetical protein
MRPHNEFSILRISLEGEWTVMYIPTGSNSFKEGQQRQWGTASNRQICSSGVTSEKTCRPRKEMGRKRKCKQILLQAK